ncbi:MAG: carbon-nitrogen hydrolase family protein [Egibacteraceae bacterium]
MPRARGLGSLDVRLGHTLWRNVRCGKGRKSLLVSAIHFRPLRSKPDHNGPALLALIESALVQGARLIVAPELALSGFAFRAPEEIAPHAQSIVGPFSRQLSKLAKKFHSIIVVGMAECDLWSGHLFNAAVIATPQTEPFTHRAPPHPEGWEVPPYRWITGFGSGPTRLMTPLGTLEVTICSHLLRTDVPPAANGPGLFAVPAAWYDDFGREPWLTQWRQIARDRRSALVLANRYGQEVYSNGMVVDFLPTSSSIIDSQGEVIAATSRREPTVLFARLIRGPAGVIGAAP